MRKQGHEVNEPRVISPDLLVLQKLQLPNYCVSESAECLQRHCFSTSCITGWTIIFEGCTTVIHGVFFFRVKLKQISRIYCDDREANRFCYKSLKCEHNRIMHHAHNNIMQIHEESKNDKDETAKTPRQYKVTSTKPVKNLVFLRWIFWKLLSLFSALRTEETRRKLRSLELVIRELPWWHQ